ncbi:DUF4416 family protein [candidate division KSB1 bacterium]|nr:DUF4416 family protein [candidate division KSB1 bacterium]
MGEIRLPNAVKLFAAITFREAALLEAVKSALITRWGAIATESDIYDFLYTEYYATEMGTGLLKQFVVFQKLIPPDHLVATKLDSNALEQQWTTTGKRRVNIDPGYISAAKLVLATTKNYAHRLYLGQGIYGDVHLRVIDRKFVPNEWTYPDYQAADSLLFFNKIRQQYLKELRQLSSGGEGRRRGLSQAPGVELYRPPASIDPEPAHD